MKIKKIIGIVCIIASILLVIIPPLLQRLDIEKESKNKDELLTEIENLMSEIDETEETFTEIELGIIDTNVPETTPTEPVYEYKPYRTSTNEEVDGILKIEKIDLELPILTNVTEKGLKKTCARVTNTQPPGSNNYSIMGHTMDAYGKVFNRLKEVRKGDEIIVVARDYTYKYVVTETFVTKGLDTSIFEDVEGKKVITIFCCSYNVTNGRLVVRGELQDIFYN